MSAYPFLSDLGALSRPGDLERRRIGAERWIETAAGIGGSVEAFAQDLLADPAGVALLAAIFGNSPFLTELLLGDIGFAQALVTHGPSETFAQILLDLNDELAADSATDAVMARLRRSKRRAALTIAVADIAGTWALEQVTASLSKLADAALDVASGHLLGLAVTGSAPGGSPMNADLCRRVRGGLVVLGMGKLGARELNYSSDIDLIVLFDPERIPPDLHRAAERTTLQQLYVRMVRGLVRMLEERTADGYVFRTDLRLRPDPASTPTAISVLAAETYYESLGQNWERAAMIKARPVAGDLEAGHGFLRRLRPFLWRKHLDFAAINDIHSIKRQINAHRGALGIAVRGHNLKLGRGGIREIEFFAQTQQLIWGGRLPALRLSGTIATLQALTAAERIGAETAARLEQAYRFLRAAEHRLQMVDDQQTHTLPEDPAELERLAAFMGYPDGAAFETAVRTELEAVAGHYADLFEEAPPLSGPGNLVFTGAENDPETVATLARMGFRDGNAVAETVRGWHHGRVRATRSVRARELLTELMPALLSSLARTEEPDAAFVRFDRFLTNMPAGIQLFSLFCANPQLLDLVAEIMGSAPSLADYLGRHPSLLDGILSDTFANQLPDERELERDLSRYLGQATDYQDVLDLVRRWTGDRKFQIGVQILRGAVSFASAARCLSAMAECVIAALAAANRAAFAASHGEVQGGAFAVLALGKLGARELTLSSDLDLIFLYQAPPGVEQSDGPKPLPIPFYYGRLGQRLISALTALTAEGELFQVDMRLRPSGNKGPVSTRFDGFMTYHRTEAWTWEHMALTRARVVAGPPAFRRTVEAGLAAILTGPRDPAQLLLDVADMRQRMAREKPAGDRFDVKLRRGGLVDVEFIAQYLLLRRAAEHPDLITGNSVELLQRLGDAGLIDPLQAAGLIRAAGLWQSLQALLRLTTEGRFDAERAPAALKAAIARVVGAVDFAEAEQDIDAAATAVTAVYRDVIDDPAERLRPPGDAESNEESPP
ncbi:MAG: bifunctional [glutamine synthetase] adenylyltransferase/[glutamine synthetase]-adenylyl-L-tyrosine phosphorylase [Myxococcales bacterium]|nr:bifunctional [glutamine synthetase] adenylyltransferase/[glutamine synthetase]-adenylyl-L-tyrosine phosphorylase [Myxococcales bacterium]